MKIYTNKKRGKRALSPFFITGYGLDPDLDLEEAEEQEEQGNGQSPLQHDFTEEFLQTAAQHSAEKTTDDNGDGEPEIRPVTVEHVPDKRTDTAEGRPDKGNRYGHVHGKGPQCRHGGHEQEAAADTETPGDDSNTQAQ